GYEENPHGWKLHFIDDPGKSIEGTIQAIKHPIETYDYLSQSIADSFERDVINGDAESRAKWISYALGNIVLSAVGTKGLGAVSKTVKATTKVGVSKVKGAAQKIPTLNLYPYAPQHQLVGVNAGGVPYNTVNSVGLRDQLISMAKVEARGSGKGTKDIGNVKHLDDVPRIKAIEVKFNRNLKHAPEEFARQLKDQEKGMNELTVDEYLKNRDRYIAEGRALEGNVAQQTTREEAFSDKIAEFMGNGKSFDEAEKEAKEWLKTQAALHNPDQIAGGKPNNIGGMGHKGINSSIGSQWRYRIDVVDEQIREMAKDMTPEN
ncbi:polymorphic toxin type 15 domain-containing protein, partial [Rummeliibacillus suwonensis]|uniref:polymorphic toxin type 15 domain-containing protein n=1 Tax=Rummeliibacillus suwonensis TaxID=1306154 RepID=UPI0028A25D2D